MKEYVQECVWLGKKNFMFFLLYNTWKNERIRTGMCLVRKEELYVFFVIQYMKK